MKDAAGKMTGEKKPEFKEILDEAKGEAHKTLGDAKDAVRRTTE
jgi:uncharacterized protein YjbJ (UPF0337 family)